MARGLFVTGTDTGAGKTILTAALLAAIASAGRRVRAYKPVVTGLEDPPGQWPPDHELLASLAHMTPRAVAPHRYGPPASPALAARLAGETLDWRELREDAAAALGAAERLDATLLVEGVGGLLAPLTDARCVRDLIAELGLPVVIASRPGLGTINHTLLTLEAARAAGLDVLAVVLTPWPHRPSTLERSNRETIERAGEVEVDVLAEVASCTTPALARAGAALPWLRWIARDGAYAGSRASSRVPEREVAEPVRAAASIAPVTAATS